MGTFKEDLRRLRKLTQALERIRELQEQIRQKADYAGLSYDGIGGHSNGHSDRVGDAAIRIADLDLEALPVRLEATELYLELSEDIQTAIGTMPNFTGEDGILLLDYMQGIPTKTIARRHELTVEAVGCRLRRCKTALGELERDRTPISHRVP